VRNLKKLTVFTPTYNRAYCLQGCYESLKQQTCKDFIWLIIDDGSDDNTKELVNSWVSEDYIDIRYYWQPNQGMHGAHNTAYEMIDTELNVCIDSDDSMPSDAVEKIINFWNENGNEQVSGIIASKLPLYLNRSTLFNLYNKHGVTGDKKLVYRTELTKKYPYPIFKNEKYVGLAYKYYMLDQKYEMLLMNEALCYVEYMPDGSSMNMLNQYRKNPKGFAFYRKELMKLPFTNRLFKYRQAVHYVSSSFIAKNIRFIKESPCKVLTLCALPFGVILYSYITVKTRVKANI
jgi:glycosyltransferase involved in cell wall biosynthesis